MSRSSRSLILRGASLTVLVAALSLPSVVGANAQPGPRGMGERMFERLDRNGDGVIEAAEIEAARERMFDVMDPNDDDVIDEGEREDMAEQRAERRQDRMERRDGRRGGDWHGRRGGDRERGRHHARHGNGHGFGHWMGGGRMDPERLGRHADRMFDMLDADNDDAVSREEFEEFKADIMARFERRAGRGEGRDHASRMRDRAEARWSAMDADGDGSISKEEFVGHMPERLAKADADGDGRITREEFDKAGEAMREEFRERRQERREERRDDRRDERRGGGLDRT